MPPTTFNSRTYGKRAVGKRKVSADELPSDDRIEGPSPQPSRKRRRISFETLGTLGNSREPSTDREDTPSRQGITRAPYSKPRKGASTNENIQPKVTSGTSRAGAATPKSTRLAGDFSQLFDTVLAAPSPPASPTKLAKRMLARSKTDSSINSDTIAKDNNIVRTPSLPILQSPPSKSHIHAASVPQEQQPAPILATTTTTTTRTYAGQARSFLVTMPVSALSTNPTSLLQTADEEDDYDTRESYASLRSRWGVDNSEDDPYPQPTRMTPTKSRSLSNLNTPDVSPSAKGNKGKKKAHNVQNLPPPLPLPNGMMNPLKSITELRSKGESRRFLDEVGYLFEGMDEKGGIGLRRTSALEITTKLCDSEFARKAKAADFFTKTLDVFLRAGAGRGDDKILDTLLIFFVALAARDAGTLTDLIERNASPSSTTLDKETQSQEQDAPESQTVHNDIVDILFSLLQSTISNNSDPIILVSSTKSLSDVDLKKAGITKKDRNLWSTIVKTISLKSFIFPEDTPISIPLLITHTLRTMPPSLIPAKYFSVLLHSLRHSLSPLNSFPSSSSQTLSSALHLTWREAAKQVSYEAIDNHLLLLDTYLLEQWITDRSENRPGSTEGVVENGPDDLEKAGDSWMVDELMALGVCAEITMKSDVSRSEPARRCMELTLRVLVSLTHADEPWARRVAQNDYTLPFIMRIISESGHRISQAQYPNRNQSAKEKNSLNDDDGTEHSIDEDHIDDEDEDKLEATHALDRLCLALGLLTNLVQVVDNMKDLLRETSLDPHCILTKRICARHCACTQQNSALIILVDIYTQQQYLSSIHASSIHSEPKGGNIRADSRRTPENGDAIDEVVDADASFLRGHLAILFGLLMQGNRANQTEILASLPLPLPHPDQFVYKTKPNPKGMVNSKKDNTTKMKLDMLIEQVREFLSFYAMVGARGILKGLDVEKEGYVAHEVVRFLEDIRKTV